MNGEKPRFNFGGNQQNQHRPMGFGQQQQPHSGQRAPEHFKQDDTTQKAILEELKEINQKLSQILETISERDYNVTETS